MPTSLSIASGKGGVGKTTVAINLAIVQAKISSCLLLDADMGMANAHILLGINPELTIKDFFDTKKFPGKRAIYKSALTNLEIALAADGVKMGKGGELIYRNLEADGGIERAMD